MELMNREAEIPVSNRSTLTRNYSDLHFVVCCCSVPPLNTLGFIRHVQLYIDRCITQGERIARVTVLYFFFRVCVCVCVCVLSLIHI